MAVATWLSCARSRSRPAPTAFRGPTGAFGLAKLGRIGDCGFIVGLDGGAIDTFTLHRHGLALWGQVARRMRAPVPGEVTTHARQEFVFGAPACRERGIGIPLHAKVAALMCAPCEDGLKTLRSMLGDNEMQQAAPFAGALLNQGRIPDSADNADSGLGRSRLSVRACRVARRACRGDRSRPRRAWHAHVIDPMACYLNALQACGSPLRESGVGLSEIAGRATGRIRVVGPVPASHRRKASVRFLRLES